MWKLASDRIWNPSSTYWKSAYKYSDAGAQFNSYTDFKSFENVDVGVRLKLDAYIDEVGFSTHLKSNSNF